MATDYVPYTGPIVTRAQAKAAGLDWYFTGVPCKRGHTDLRYTSNANCVACNHLRAGWWRRDNRERFDAAAAAWRAVNKERFKGYHDKWRKSDGGIATHQAWIVANKDRIDAQRTALRLANPLRWKCYAENRRARKAASNGNHTPGQIADLAELQKHKCANCNVSIRRGYEAD